MARNAIGRNPAMNLPEPKNIKHMLLMASDDAGDKIAYKFRTKEGVREITYREFRMDTLYIGTALNSIGMASGHIGCCAENSYNWITVFLTALQSEGVFCPIDKELPDEDLAKLHLGKGEEMPKKWNLPPSDT